MSYDHETQNKRKISPIPFRIREQFLGLWLYQSWGEKLCLVKYLMKGVNVYHVNVKLMYIKKERKKKERKRKKKSLFIT